MDNKVCIFCGRTGAEVKITREHTFPNWINAVLPAAVVGPDITYERRIQHGSNAATVNTWPASEVAGHVLRAVCTNCNSGWMQRWESAVRPLIEPMIKGEARLGTNFIGIFPPAPKTVQWPPPHALNDQTLPAFTHPLLALADAG